MKSILIVSDPISSGVSVQLNVINFLRSKLSGKFKVYVYWNCISAEPNRASGLDSVDLVNSGSNFNICRLLPKRFKSNEGILWVLSWIVESMLGIGAEDVKKVVENNQIDYVVNISSTIPCKSDVLIIQGIPFLETLNNLSESSSSAHIVRSLFWFPILLLQRKLLAKFKSGSKKIYANSKYIKDYYENLGFKVPSVIHTVKNFSMFKRNTAESNENYVLSYIGKETEIKTLIELAKKGVKIITFGSKVPPGISIDYIKNFMEVEGHVSDDRLVRLYSGALFTAFPFTEEPFGYIPIESSLCGTPVLTYNKQGPLETVCEGENGWLVSSRGDFISKGLEIWNRKDSGINPIKCIEFAKKKIDEFSSELNIDQMVTEN